MGKRKGNEQWQKLDRFYTIADVADHFGVSVRTVRRWLARDLPAHKLGNVLRIAEADILAFAARHRRD